MHLFPSVSPPLVHDGQPAARILWSRACVAPSIHQRGQQDRSWGNVAIYDEINVTIATFSVNSNRQMYYSEHQNNVFLPDYKGLVLLNAFYIRKRVRQQSEKKSDKLLWNCKWPKIILKLCIYIVNFTQYRYNDYYCKDCNFQLNVVNINKL